MAAAGGSPVRAIFFAFGANLGIAVIKAIAAFVTGSSSLVAEAIHSVADTGNQLLLLHGLRQSKLPPDPEHPLGHGKASYFWSFIVAIMLFSLGGLFSVYEGWHKLQQPTPVANLTVALLVLGVSVLLEGGSLLGCLREINRVRGRQSLWQWLHRSRNSELVVVFGEDFAALLGLALALMFVVIAGVTGDGFYDALGSICIGVLLICVALFVSLRVKSLLIGRSADPDLVTAISELIAEDEGIQRVYNVLTLQMGAQVMLAAKIRLAGGMEITDACHRINRLERALRRRFPEIGWCFIEPDIDD